MEATLQAESALPTAATQPEVKKTKSSPVPMVIAAFAVLILGALGLVVYAWLQIHNGSVPLTKEGLQSLASLHSIQAVILVLAGVAFAVIVRSMKRALADDAHTIEKQSEDIATAAKNITQTKGELDHANSQLAHTLFQLQNANVQFDIITSELDSAKREADAIFATVRQGLFLLGPDGTIGAQVSGESKAIFEAKELAKRNFSQMLRPLLPEKRYQTVSDFLELLFDPRKNEKQLQRFNPLKRAELNFPSPDGGYQPKHVEFSFQRIVNDNAVSRVMVTVLDVSERVKLENKVREGEQLREKQLDLLFDLLQVDSANLRTFIDDANASIEKINGILKEPGTGEAGQLQDKVQRVFRTAHNLKSHAASAGLHLFEQTIHQIENQLNEHRRNTALVNEDLLPVLVSIANFQAQLQDAAALIQKITDLRGSFNSTAAPEQQRSATAPIVAPQEQPSAALVRSVEELAKTVATRSGKQVRLEWRLSGNFDRLPLRNRRLLQNSIFQLVRNSIVHGIELPPDRARASKAPIGCVSIKLTKLPGENRVLLVCRDDGKGLDAAAIRERAVREKLIAEDAQLSEDDLYALIFAPGFSTVDAANEDAGRGVGLDVIRAEIVDELHGEIQIGFSQGQYTEIGIIIPEE